MPCIMAQAGELLGGSVAEIVSEGFLRNVLASTKKNSLDNILENLSENTWEGVLEKHPWNISRLVHRKISVPESLFLIKLQASGLLMTQVFPCEFCEIFKNIFFYETPLVAASEFSFIILTLSLRSF